MVNDRPIVSLVGACSRALTWTTRRLAGHIWRCGSGRWPNYQPTGHFVSRWPPNYRCPHRLHFLARPWFIQTSGH